MPKFKRGVTPIGEACFANLIKPEEFQGKSTGKYTIMLKLAPEAHKKILADVADEFAKYKEQPENKGKKFPTDYANGEKSYKETDYLKFTMNAEITLKDKTIIEKHVPIFDANKKEISKMLPGLGNGSKVRVSYELVPFHISARNAGVSLRLLGVQVIDLIEYGGSSAEALGFEGEEGYTADADGLEQPVADGGEGDF